FDLLDRLARQDAGYATAALETMKRLALDLGDKARADAFDTRRQVAERRDATAAKGFETALVEANLEAHGLPDHLVRVLARQLGTDGAIATAYSRAFPAGAKPPTLVICSSSASSRRR